VINGRQGSKTCWCPPTRDCDQRAGLRLGKYA